MGETSDFSEPRKRRLQAGEPKSCARAAPETDGRRRILIPLDRQPSNRLTDAPNLDYPGFLDPVEIPVVGYQDCLRLKACRGMQMSAASRSGRYGLQRAAASSPISATSRIFPVSRPRISSLVSEFNSSASRLYSSNSQRLPNSSSSLSVTNLIKRAKEPVSVLAVRLRPENGFIAATKTFVSTTKRLGTLSPSDPIIRLRLDPPCYFIHVFPLKLHSESVCDFLYVELLQYQVASVRLRQE